MSAWRRRVELVQRVPARYSSSSALMAMAYAGLVVYASLYPFTGWRLGSASVWSFWSQPLPTYWTFFDMVANWLGYVPVGFLAIIALIRQSWRPLWAFVLALGLGASLSSILEILQNFLPQRVPSNLDTLLNTLGVLLGAAMGWLLHQCGRVARWQTVREQWFLQPSAGGIVLLCIWPLGLLFPLSLPFAMGQVAERVRDRLLVLLSETPWADWAQALTFSPVLRTFTPTGEFLLITLGLLGPCCLVLAISSPGWRCRTLLLVLVMTGALTTSLSGALSFGPEHAWTWATPLTWWAMGAATLLALLFSCASRRVVATLGLMALAALVALVSQAPSDPYFALNLQSWEQGRFIRFYGAAQWVGWLWPFMAMGYLMSVVAGRFHADSPVKIKP